MLRQRNTHAPLDELRAHSLFADWPDSELALLALDADVLWLRTPHALLREGVVPREFYLLLNGDALVSGAHVRPAVLRPGALIGAEAVLSATPSPVSVMTTEPARVLAFGWAGIQRIEQRAAETGFPVAHAG